MEYRSLGRCGTKVSKFGFGGWATFGDSVNSQSIVNEIIKTAYEAGINFFDMADVYAGGESERMMGKSLAEFPRHTLVLSSKVFWPASKDVNDRGLSRKHLMESIERSLKRIGTDYLDIYFCHRFDPETPIEETARAMDDLVHQGKILYWGTSEWTDTQLLEAHHLCEKRNLYRPQVEQPLYNLIERTRFENDIQPVAEKTGMGIVTFSPLASGFLTGKYDAGIPEGTRMSRIGWLKEQILTETNLARMVKFRSFAEEIGYPRSQLALAWTASQPGVSSVILGATRREQLSENLKALNVKITGEIHERLIEIFPKRKA